VSGRWRLQTLAGERRRAKRWRSRCVEASAPLAIALARLPRVLASPNPAGCDHRNAIDGARSDTKLAARANGGEHRMHPLRRADDRIDGTRLDAERAADAGRFIDPRRPQRAGLAACGVERHDGTSGERSEPRDDGGAPRWAAVDWRAVPDRFGIRTTTVVAAATALRLRQHGVNAVGEIGCGAQAHPPHFTEPPGAAHARPARRALPARTSGVYAIISTSVRRECGSRRVREKDRATAPHA